MYKNYFVKTNLRWDYWKSRRDAKSIIAQCQALRIFIQGYELQKHELLEVLSGRKWASVFFKAINNKKYWYPEDYIGEGCPTNEFEAHDCVYSEINVGQIIRETRLGLEQTQDRIIERLESKRVMFRDSG